MNKSALVLFAALCLAGCNAAAVTKVQTDVAQAKVIVDAGACDAQKAANDATDILTAAGDVAGAAQAASISKTAGSACLTLAAAS